MQTQSIITIIDLTGSAPEMNYGFKPLVEAAKASIKQVIVHLRLDCDDSRPRLRAVYEGFGFFPL